MMRRRRVMAARVMVVTAVLAVVLPHLAAETASTSVPTSSIGVVEVPFET